MNKLHLALLALVTVLSVKAAQEPETIGIVDRAKFLHAFRTRKKFEDTNGTIQAQTDKDAQQCYYIDKNNSVYMPNYELHSPRLRRFDVNAKGKLRPTDHYFSVGYDNKNNQLVFTEIIE